MSLVTFLLAGLALLWGAVVAWTAWMLMHPPRRTYAGAVARGVPGDPSELAPARAFRGWAFRAGGLELPVWEVEGEDPGGPVVVLTHGWADSRIGGLARVAALAPVASRLVLWDLPGHGEAPGLCRLGPPEGRVLRALLAELRRAAAPAVVLYGWSLGAGLSIEVAGEDAAIAGVIAESPYRFPATPAGNVLAARGLPYRETLPAAMAVVRALGGPSPWLDRGAQAARVRCPVLVVHGSVDRVSPVEDGRAIAAAAPRGELVEVEGAGHNDLWSEPRFRERLMEVVRAFVRSGEARGGDAPAPADLAGRERPGSHSVAR